MGKVKPPDDVFNSWTPEAQNGYNAQIDGMAANRDSHLANAAEENLAAESADKRRDYYFKTGYDEAPKTTEDLKDGQGGMMVGNYALAFKEREKGNQHRKNAEEETQKATELDQEVKRLTIGEADPNSDVNESKERYLKEVGKSIQEDKDRLREKEQERDKVQNELDDTWFFGKDELRDRIKELNKEIESIKSDIAFNQQNLVNTNPPMVVMPSAPSAPVVQTYVTMGANLTCPLAIPNGTPKLSIDPSRQVLIKGALAANIMDFKPGLNIPPMGQCTTMSNPAVAAATAAKLGVFTPAPCVPLPIGPWKPGKPDVLIENFPALLSTDTLSCTWGGVISILPG